MPTKPHRRSIISDLDSHSPPPTDHRRIRVGGRLKGIGNTVFVPHLGYNGMIVEIVGRRHLSVLPHDYGYTIKILPWCLMNGVGINAFQRLELDKHRMYYYNPVLLDKGTVTVPH